MGLKIPRAIYRLARKYGVTVRRDSVNCPRNNAAAAGWQIMLGEFDDPDLEFVAFFHELGHTQSDHLVLKRGSTMSRISGEAVAWELGLGLAYSEGYQWEYNSKEMAYARNRLFSYLRGETMKNFRAEVRRESRLYPILRASLM